MKNIDRALSRIKSELPGLLLMENEPLSSHSSFRIGGPAKVIALPSDVSTLSRLCFILKENNIQPYPLGNGTNILFPDEGLPNLFIISTEKLDGMFLLEDGGIYAEAGVSLSRLSSFAAQHSLTGLEFAGGIPGSVGGGTIMNAGAYGGELKDVIDSVVAFNTNDMKFYNFTGTECAFGYRTSIFHSSDYIVVSAVFRPLPGSEIEIRAKMSELSSKRREKQPLEYPSAGSTFKRPEGYFAAALIDQSGLKGCRVGGAQVSEKHAGFVINKGGATSHDVIALMQLVHDTVLEKNGVELEPEIIILPADYSQSAY